MKPYLKSATSGIFRLLFSIALVFVSIPMFIHTYGMSVYGIFSVVAIFGNLTLLFNFGLNSALLKFISGSDAMRPKNRHVTVSLLVLGAIAVVVTTVLLLFQSYIITDIFRTNAALNSDVLFCFKLFLLANFFVVIGQPFMALMQAANDFYMTRIIQWMYHVLNCGGIILLCRMNVPFRYIALPALIVAIAWFGLLLYLAVKKYGFRWAQFSSPIQFMYYVKRQLSFSRQIYFSSLLTFCNEPLLRILVIKYLGPQAAGSFDIVLKIKSQLIALFTKVFEPLSPMLASRHNKKELRHLVHYSEQLAAFVFIPICFLVYFFAGPVLHLWMKDIPEQLVTNIKTTVIIFTCSMIVLPNYYYLTFHNRIKDCMKIQFTGVFSSLVFFFTFKNIFVATTPVMSICVGIVLAFTISVYYQWKYLRSIIFDKYTIYSLLSLSGLTALYIMFNRLHWNIPVLVVIATVLFVSVKYIMSMQRRGIYKISGYNKLAL